MRLVSTHSMYQHLSKDISDLDFDIFLKNTGYLQQQFHLIQQAHFVLQSTALVI